NRLAGNTADAATFETSGGLVLRAMRDTIVVLTGPDCEAFVDDVPLARCRATRVAAGQCVRVNRMYAGMRSYLAVAGGIECPMMLGSRSHDTLSAIVPQPLTDGVELSVGTPRDQPQSLDVPIGPTRSARIQVSVGPHAELFAREALEQLTRMTWRVSPASNRVGVRLTAPTDGDATFADSLKISSLGEVDSLPLVRGAVQLAPSGELVIMLADHPTTGGYPIIAVVHPEDVDQLAQSDLENVNTGLQFARF
ncbi:MAG: biotin-dependent carboxyltransferase, partial [Oxalobacteraceae bacterium]|nr:biotin-dependent carboxyltransferase [Oxalobacteraceae bacterium]